MTRTARIGFLAAAFVVLVVAFVVIGTGGDETSEQADNPPAPAATTTQDGSGSGGVEAEPQATPTPEPVTRIRTQDGEPTGDVERIEVDKGERIRFVVSSNVAEEIHVHGFDRYADVGPGEPARLDFKANIDGIFEVELHGSAAQIAELVINP